MQLKEATAQLLLEVCNGIAVLLSDPQHFQSSRVTDDLVDFREESEPVGRPVFPLHHLVGFRHVIKREFISMELNCCE